MKKINSKEHKQNVTVGTLTESQNHAKSDTFGYKPLMIINGAAEQTKGQHMDHPKETYYWIYPKP